MKKFYGIIIGIFFCYVLHAQIIYTDVNPDSNTIETNDKLQYNLDFNKESVDFKLIANSSFRIWSCLPPACNFESIGKVTITGFNGNAVSLNNSGYPSRLQLDDKIGIDNIWNSNPNLILRKESDEN